MTHGERLLQEHVERFNVGVRSGDFGPMVDRFADVGVLEFTGIPVGPFRGRQAIATAYREQPPDDEVRVLAIREPGPGVVPVEYAWLAAPEERAGEMRLEHRDGWIQRLLITYLG